MYRYSTSIKSGICPAIFSMIVIIGGGAAQLRTIWMAKSVVSTSGFQLALQLIGCILWAEYGRLNQKKEVVAPQLTATTFTLAAIGEYIYFM